MKQIKVNSNKPRLSQKRVVGKSGWHENGRGRGAVLLRRSSSENYEGTGGFPLPSLFVQNISKAKWIKPTCPLIYSCTSKYFGPSVVILRYLIKCYSILTNQYDFCFSFSWREWCGATSKPRGVLTLSEVNRSQKVKNHWTELTWYQTEKIC